MILFFFVLLDVRVRVGEILANEILYVCFRVDTGVYHIWIKSQPAIGIDSQVSEARFIECML